MNRQQVCLPALMVSLLALAACGERAGDSPPQADRGIDPAARFVALASGEDATADDWFALAQAARDSR